MTKKIILALSLILASGQVAATSYYATGTTSVFTDGTTWTNTIPGACGGSAYPAGTAAPSTTDTVGLCPGTTVTLAAPASIGTLAFASGILNLGTFDLTVNRDLTNAAMTPTTINGTGAIALSDANHTINLVAGVPIIPKLTLPNPTVTRTLVFTGGTATFTALSAIPTTSAGKGFVFNAGDKTVNFPAGTTIAYCDKTVTTGAINNLTCTNPSGVLPLPAVSAPIFSLKDKPAIFSEEVK